MTRTRWLLVCLLAAALAVGAIFRRQIILRARGLVAGSVTLVMPRELLPSDVLAEFEDRTGVEVKVVTYANVRTLYAMLLAPDAHYDLVMLPPYGAQHLMAAGRLRSLDQARLPHLDNVDRKNFSLTFDRAYDFVIPYEWGSVGIAYTRNQVEGIPKSWADMFRHYDRTRSKGGVALMDLPRYVLGTALIFQGRSPNSENPAEIAAAGELLMSLHDQITYVDTHNALSKVLEKKAAMALAWGPDVAKAMTSKKDLRLSLPSEGSILYRICFAVLKSAPNPHEAELLIDYLLDSEIAARVTNDTFNPTTVRTASPFVDRFILNGPAYFRNPAGKNFELADISPAANAVYLQVWGRFVAPFGLTRPPGAAGDDDLPTTGPPPMN